jgi:hypothetical protein
MTDEERNQRAERQFAKWEEDLANGKTHKGGPSFDELDGPSFVHVTPENTIGTQRVLDLINGVTPTER